MRPGLYGKKLGMTQFWDGDKVVPCTIIEIPANHVVAVRTQEKDGYSAVQVGVFEAREKHVNKPRAGQFQASGVAPTRLLREIRLSEDTSWTVGQALTVGDVFNEGEKVDISGISKGKGFAGVVKRWHFAGQIDSHGAHEWTRHGGSIGTRLTPGRVLKGKKMAGQMGNERVTVQNLTVVKIDAEKGHLLVRGAVPGGKNGTVLVRTPAKVRRARQKGYVG